MGKTANGRHLERADKAGDMNEVAFPPDFFAVSDPKASDNGLFPLTLHACQGGRWWSA